MTEVMSEGTRYGDAITDDFGTKKRRAPTDFVLSRRSY
ncbi:MAG: hypothetical protein BWY75_01440 [bacterium ADurb.Bin425]|nr:MAG: hypothetical protein BWY75_01440 [bacterium ADurb.Bin425]